MSVTVRVPWPTDLDRLVRVPVPWSGYLALGEDHRAEYVDGYAVVSPSPVAGHQRVARRIANLIEAGCPGLFVVEAVGVWTGERRSRVPDVMATASSFEGSWAEQAPVVVVEVLSPSTRREDTLRKSVEYRETGIEQYWILDREQRSITVLVGTPQGWDVALDLDDAGLTGAAGTVVIGEHGTVGLDLGFIFAP